MTGGAGFVGSHLVDALLGSGWDVLVVDDLSSGNADSVAPRARLERLDIAVDDLDGPTTSWRPRVVFHLAAQASVPRSMDAPLRDLAVNVTGTNRICAAARAAGAKRLVFVSSGGAIYGDGRRPATETTLPAPMSYYGVHKLAAEGHVALAGVPYAIARPMNIYGPRQTAGLEGAVVAAFVSRARAGGPLTIHGDGLQTRDFVHVRDIAEALLRLADASTPSGTWNIASGRSVTILELAGLVERAMGRELGLVHQPTRAGDVRSSHASSARLRALGWKPAVTLARGIRELVAPPIAAVGAPVPRR